MSEDKFIYKSSVYEWETPKEALEAEISALQNDITRQVQITTEQQQEIEYLRAQLAACREDAERWRKVSSMMTHEHSGPNVGWTLGELLPGDDPESAIDAARKERA